MEGRAFLKVAQEVIQGDSEAHRRAAAGRAYYALMLEAREFLNRQGFVRPPHDSIHSFVRLNLIYSVDSGLQQVGFTLERLGRLRNEADYQLTDPHRRFSRSEPVEIAIQNANEAIAMLDEVENDEDRRLAAIRPIQPE